MRTSLFYFIILFFTCQGYLLGQAIGSVSAKQFMKEYRAMSPEIRESNEFPEVFVKKNGLYKINGEWYIGVAVKTDNQLFDVQALKNAGVISGSVINDIRSFQIPVREIEIVNNTPGILYYDMGADGLAPVMDRAIQDIGADTVKLGLGTMPQAFNGSGVVVGVIDWGFDYGHPTFYDTSGVHLRIVKAWDQNRNIGTPPAGYTYGAEFSTEADLLSIGSDTTYIFGTISHGTHVAGIAAGSGYGSGFEGLAPEAELILITNKQGVSSFIDALAYIRDYATSQNKPFVINMSFGSHLGPHDGTSLENQAISQIVGSGAVVVGGAGNTNVNGFHIKAPLDSVDTATTVWYTIPWQFPGSKGNSAVLWGSPGDSFSVELMLMSSSLDTVYRTGWINSANNPSIDTAVLAGTDSIYYIVEGIASDPNNNRANIRFDLENYTNLYALLRFTGEGHVHGWSLAKYDTYYSNFGYPFFDAFPGFTPVNAINGDLNYSVSEPPGVGASAITVGAYNTITYSPAGNMQGGVIASFSAQGPTTDERVKPDITAPGVNIISGVSSFAQDFQNSVASVAFNGKTYQYARFSGTSMSGPVVAGAVALMLEANPSLGWNHTLDIIRQTARQDNVTGTIPATGNNVWGWGRLDVYAAVERAVETVSLKRFSGTDKISMYPNPANDQIVIDFSQASNITSVEIYDVNGRCVEQFGVDGLSQKLLDVGALRQGVYFLNTLSKSGHRSSHRLLINR